MGDIEDRLSRYRDFATSLIACDIPHNLLIGPPA